MLNDRMARIAVVAVTCVFVFVEWLLCELMRLPYAPPHDMSTFLGTEKYSVPYVIGGIASAWGLFLVWMAFVSRFTLWDFFGFLAIVALLATGFGLVIAFPMWPVSPPHLVWGGFF